MAGEPMQTTTPKYECGWRGPADYIPIEAVQEEWRKAAIHAPSASPVARVQAWLAAERAAGRCVIDPDDAWIARLLEAADGR